MNVKFIKTLKNIKKAEKTLKMNNFPDFKELLN